MSALRGSKYSMTVKAKIILVIMVTTVAALGAAGIGLIVNERAQSMSMHEKNMAMLARIVGSTSSAALVFGDHEAASNIVSSLKGNDSINAACLYDDRGTRFATYRGKDASATQCPERLSELNRSLFKYDLLTIEPIVLEDQEIGKIFVASDYRLLHSQMDLFMKTMASVLLLATLGAFVFSSFAQRYISYRILELASTARQVSLRNDYSLRVKPLGRDEIRALIDAFNGMLDQIEAHDQERRRLLFEAQDAILLRDEFISVAAHELRTPITPIKMQLYGIKRLSLSGALATYPKEKLEKMVDVSERQLGRLIALVDDLLDISKLSSGMISLHPERVNLSRISKEILDQFLPRIKNSAIVFERYIDPDVMLTADPARIEQMLSNLIENALKYGKGKPISFSLRSEKNRVVIVVKDRGIGIRREDQDRIFSKFERAVSSKHFGGLGLGLFISRQIVEAHKGSIRVESTPNEGSSFIVELPA